MEDDRSPLVLQTIAFREKMLEVLADLQVDLTTCRMALEEAGISRERFLALKREAQKNHEGWIDRNAERLPTIGGPA